MKPVTDAQVSLTQESDFGLLTIIGCAEIDRDQAEHALEILYERHARLLMGIAIDCRWQDLGVDPEELLHETFLKAWECAGDFDPRKRYEKISPEKAVKLWLIKIFKRKFLDELRAIGRKPELILTSPDELDDQRSDMEGTETPPDDDGLSPEDESENVALVQKWIATQTPSDCDLLLTSAMHIDFRKGNYVIPKDELCGLAATLGVLPESIKVKRARLLQRLKTFLQQHQSST